MGAMDFLSDLSGKSAELDARHLQYESNGLKIL